MQIETVLTGYDTFNGTNAKGEWTKTVFTDQNGVELATFKGDIASKAKGLLNVPVRVEYEDPKNPKYTQKTLLDAAALNGHAQAPQAAPQQAEQFMRRRDPAETLAIHKQSALQRAIETFAVANIDPLADLEGLYQLADRFIGYFHETDLRDS